MDTLCQLQTDPLDPGEGFYTGTADFPESAKLPHQLLATFRSEPRNVFQSRFLSGLGTALPVPGDGKAVCFITQMLDQQQGS